MNSGHALRGRDVQTPDDVQRKLPKLSPDRQIHKQDLPPQRLRQRRVVLGYPTEQVEPDL